MARSAAVAGTLVVHAAIAVVAVVLTMRGGPGRPGAPSGAVMIEIDSSPPPALPTTTPTTTSQAPAGIQAPATPVPRAPGPAPAAAPRAPRLSTPVPDTMTQIEPTTGALRDPGGPGGEGGGGPGLDGEGHTSNRERGIGFGAGARIAPSTGLLPPLPAPPPPSKARPPRRIYPVRERDADEWEEFVMSVTVDADGVVVGADLLRRPDRSRRDDEEVIWRFRYEPALDDDGRPITATIEQHFLVE